MNLVTALGLLAGTLTTVAFVPQVIRTWKSKSTKDLSLPMLVSFTTGVLLLANLPGSGLTRCRSP